MAKLRVDKVVDGNIVWHEHETSDINGLDSSKSAGWLTGGAFTDNGDGTMTVGSGTGFFRASTTMSDELIYVEWDEDTNVSLTDHANNYISVDYNSGSPIIVSGTTSTANGQTTFNLGLVFREGTDLHFARAGQTAVDPIRMIQSRFNANGMIQLVSGGTVAETGERYLTVSGAILYGGLTRFVTDAIDTSATDTFEYYYTDGVGGWQYISETATQINNSQYDNGGTLTNLTANRFRTDFVYLTHDGDILVILGTNNSTLIDAEAIQPPSSLPAHASGFATVIAKVIVQEGETNLDQVDNLVGTTFATSSAVIHNETTNIQGGTTDEYYHLTSDEHTAVGTLGDIDDLDVRYIKKSNDQDLPDMGREQESSADGITKEYITSKKLYNIILQGFVRDPGNGALRINVDETPDTFEIYLRDAWQTILYDLTTENGDFRHTPLSEDIYVWRGDSIKVGLNGQPIIQEYNVSMGAFPPFRTISGGTT